MDISTLIAQARAACADTPPESCTVPVDDDLDIQFLGWEIAIGKCGDRAQEDDWTRWTVVSLFITDTGKYVVSVSRHSTHPGQGDRYHAFASSDFGAILTYLRDGNGRIGPASKEMLDEVYDALPCMREAAVRRI
jgi:hypothetical protein